MKKMLSLLLVAIMVLAMIPAAMADDEIVINVYHYAVEGQKADAIEEIANRFAAANPDQKIRFEYHIYSQGGSPNYFDQLQTAVMADPSSVDLMMGNPGIYTDLIEEGYIMDLTGEQLIKDLGLTDCDMGDVSYEGRWLAYPVDFKTWGVYYNVDMFNQLGLSVPTTKTELLNVCETLFANGIAPWAQWYKDGASVAVEVRDVFWGGAKEAGQLDMFEKLMSGEAKVSDYPSLREAIADWGDRIGAGKGWALPEAVANDQTAANETFISGKAGMLAQGTWNIGTIEEKIAGNDNFHYGFFFIPHDDSGKPGRMGTQVDQAFMINPQGKSAEWAKKFMEYWLSNEMGFWSDATYQPCITGASTENTTDLLKVLLDGKAAGYTVGYGDFTRSFSSAFITAIRKGLTAYATWACTGVETEGVKDVDTCLEYIQKLFDDEIAQAAL